MPNIVSIRNKFINEAWIPFIKYGGDILFPRLKINKKMKVLSLMERHGCGNILNGLTQNNLSKKEFIIGWNKSIQMAMRLELEAVDSVVGGLIYEDRIQDNPDRISDRFPFDVIILDITSQDPDFDDSDLEKEIECIEHTFNTQSNRGCDGMVLIYTTILTTNDLDLVRIKENSDQIRINGWEGISNEGFSQSITEVQDKIKYIKKIFVQLSNKYGYRIVDRINTHSESLMANKEIISLLVLIKKVD